MFIKDRPLNVYWVDNHDHHWPVGVASVVVALNAQQATILLDGALIARGLKPFAEKPYTLNRIETEIPHAIIIRDGNY